MYALGVSGSNRQRVLVLHGGAGPRPPLPDVEFLESTPVRSLDGEIDCILLGPASVDDARAALAQLDLEGGPPVVVLLAAGEYADCTRLIEVGAYECFDAGVDDRRLARALDRATEAHRLRVRSALREAEFSSIVERRALGVARIGLDGRLLTANEALERLLGYEAGELPGVTWGALFESAGPDASPDPGPRVLVARHHDGDAVRLNAELQLIRSLSGADHHYLLHCTPVVDAPLEMTRLRESETPLYRALRAANASTYEVDLVHPERTAAFGIHPLLRSRPESAEASDDWWASLIHPEDVQAFRRARLEQIAHGGVSGAPQRYRLRRADGRWVTIDDHREVVRDADGRPLKLVGTIVDVTARAAVESELARSEERFRLAAEAANALVYEADLERGIVSIVRGLTEVLGYRSSDDLSFGWWHDAIHPDDRAAYQRDLAEQLEQGGSRRVEYRIRNAAGEWRHVEDYRRIVPPAEGVPGRIVGTVLDVTDRRLAAEALRESDRRLREAFRAGELGAWAYDVASGDLHWDERMRELYGVSADDEVTLDLFMARIQPEDRVALAGLPDNLERSEYEFRILRPDGETRWVHASDRAEYDASGMVSRRFGLNRDITAQKLAEQELRETAERLRLAQEVAGTGAVTVLIDKEMLVLNDQAMQIYGLDASTVAIRDQFWRIHPEDRGRLLSAVNAARDPNHSPFGQDFRIEYRYLRPDGAWRWIEGRGRTLFEPQSGAMRAMRSIVTIRDVTEQRAAEVALRESEERERLARTIAGIAILSWDVENDTLEWGPRAQELFGLATPLTSPNELFKRVHREDRARLAREVAVAINPARHLEDHDFETEGRIVRPDGTLRWIMARSRVFFAGQGADRHLSRVLSTAQDITERKRVEEEMLDREQRLRLALELGQLGTVTYYPGENRLEWGPRARAMNGLSAPVTSFREFMEGVHPDDRARVQSETLDALDPSRDGELSECEYRIVLPSGEARWLHRRFAVVFDGEGHARRARRMLITLRDVTDRRRFEQAQQEFLAMASHELRNPLAALKGYASLMLRRGRYDEAGARAIVQQANHLERLVRDLLDITTATTGHFRLRLGPVDLVEVARTAVSEQQRTTGQHRVHVRQAPAELVGTWDADRVHQILTNLLSNAIKYSPDGGDVAVDIIAESDYVRLRVEDHGIGIAPEERETIFQRFYRVESQTGRTEGLGLGLDVTRALVEAHRGRIVLESDIGRGSVFTVLLPLDPPVRADSSRALASDLLNGGQRVLIVDDDPLVRDLLSNALADDGYDVLVAADGFGALELLEQGNFDVLVVDLTMPRMDGATLVRALRESGRADGLGIVVASAAYSAKEQADALGAHGVVEKPFDLQRVSQAIRDALRRTGSHAHAV